MSWKVRPVAAHQFLWGLTLICRAARYRTAGEPGGPRCCPVALTLPAAALRAPTAQRDIAARFKQRCSDGTHLADGTGNIPLLVLVRPALPSLQPFRALFRSQAA